MQKGIVASPRKLYWDVILWKQKVAKRYSSLPGQILNASFVESASNDADRVLM